MIKPRGEVASKLVQEIDKIYWKNKTSEGRINAITDFMISVLNAHEEKLMCMKPKTFSQALADWLFYTETK